MEKPSPSHSQHYIISDKSPTLSVHWVSMIGFVHGKLYSSWKGIRSFIWSLYSFFFSFILEENVSTVEITNNCNWAADRGWFVSLMMPFFTCHSAQKEAFTAETSGAAAVGTLCLVGRRSGWKFRAPQVDI